MAAKFRLHILGSYYAFNLFTNIIATLLHAFLQRLMNSSSRGDLFGNILVFISKLLMFTKLH